MTSCLSLSNQEYYFGLNVFRGKFVLLINPPLHFPASKDKEGWGKYSPFIWTRRDWSVRFIFANSALLWWSFKMFDSVVSCVIWRCQEGTYFRYICEHFLGQGFCLQFNCCVQIKHYLGECFSFRYARDSARSATF